MTIETLIANVKSVNGKSAHSNAVFLMWINELEAEIQLKLWLLSVEDIIQHTAVSEELLADAAHTIVYRLYLNAMIDLANGEYTSYQNTYKVFSDAYGDYKCWYIMKYHPGEGEAEELGYYLSAYALAVKHGYEGTEEEWIAAVEAARLSAEESAAAALTSANAAALSETNVAENAEATQEAAQAALSAKGSAEAASASAISAKDAAEAAQEAAELAEAHAETAEANAETAEGGAVTAKNDAITAKDAAVVAKTAAEAAKGAAETAQLAAETAQGLAETAKTAAESAQTGAVSAKDAAITAKNAAVAAQGLAETANTAAQGAKTAAETAQGLAEDARDAAQGYASDAHTDALAAASAKTDAQTAKTAADLAETNAETAQGFAEAAKTSAELAEAHAELAETNAETAQGLAEGARADAVAAKNAAQTAQTNAELAETHAETAEANAETAETNAEGHAEDAEAWADGTINGVAVTSEHPAYHNNSKYYKEQAAEIVGGDYPTKTEAQGYATTAKNEAISAASEDATTKANAAAAASIPKSLATAASQFLVSSGAGAWVIKTVAEIKTLLGLGSAAYTDSTAYATSGQGTKADGAIQSSLGTAADQALVSTGSGTWAVKTLAQIKTWLGLGAAAYLATGTTSGTVATGDHTHTSSGVTDFADAVRSTILTGISTATNAVIAATDTVLEAIGKLQAQITARLSLSGGTMTGALNEALTTIALASTMNIGAATGNYLIVTAGTGPITAFDVIAWGARRTLRFAVPTTITYHATNMLLPGAADLSVAAGDVLTFVSGGAGVWRCTDIQPWAGYAAATHKTRHATGGADALSPSDIGAASKISGTATLATANWTGSSAPYSYALTITGLLSTDTPHVDRVTGTDAAAAALINTAWGLIAGYAVKPQTSANTITFYASAIPAVAIPIIYEVVRT